MLQLIKKRKTQNSSCSSLSHSVMLQSPSRRRVGTFCCSSLSHSVMLQYTVNQNTRTHSCSSLSHSVMLQLCIFKNALANCCSSLSHSVMLQFSEKEISKGISCSSLSHSVMLQCIVFRTARGLCCSSLSHSVMLQYISRNLLFLNKFLLIFLEKNVLKTAAVGLSWPFFPAVEAHLTTVSCLQTAFPLPPNSAQNPQKEGLRTTLCCVSVTSLCLLQCDYIPIIEASDIRLAAKTDEIG